MQIKTLKIINTLPLVSFYVLLMLGFKIQCKNITFRAVSGNEKKILRGNGGFVLIYMVVKRIHPVSVPLGICDRFVIKIN